MLIQENNKVIQQLSDELMKEKDHSMNLQEQVSHLFYCFCFLLSFFSERERERTFFYFFTKKSKFHSVLEMIQFVC